MEDIGLEVLKSYGIFGFVIVTVVVGGTLFVNRITNYFIGAIETRDKALKEISEKFFNTMSEYSKSLEKLYTKHDTMSDDIEKIKKKILSL